MHIVVATCCSAIRYLLFLQVDSVFPNSATAGALVVILNYGPVSLAFPGPFFVFVATLGTNEFLIVVMVSQSFQWTPTFIVCHSRNHPPRRIKMFRTVFVIQ